jgi:hypothetical protein
MNEITMGVSISRFGTNGKGAETLIGIVPIIGEGTQSLDNFFSLAAWRGTMQATFPLTSFRQ